MEQGVLDVPCNATVSRSCLRCHAKKVRCVRAGAKNRERANPELPSAPGSSRKRGRSESPEVSDGHRKSRKHARVQVSDSEVEAEATARKGKEKEGPGPRIVSLSDPALGMIQREVARANKTLARTSRAVSGPVRNAADTNQNIG